MKLIMGIRTISKDLEKVAIEELNENPDKNREHLEHFRKWLLEQPHLNARTDDQFLITFLRGCKWDIPRAKEKIDYFYTTRSRMREHFVNRDPSDPVLHKMIELGVMYPLPKIRESDGSRVIFADFSVMDFEAMTLKDFVKLFFTIQDILMMEDDNFVICGQTVIADFSKVPINFYLQFTPSIVRQFFSCWQNGYPLRIKNIVEINTPSILVNIYNILIRPFLSKKLQSRFHLFNSENNDKAYDYIPQCLFPEKLGGENGTSSENIERCKKMVEGYRQWLLDDTQYVASELLRQGKPKTYDDEVDIEVSLEELGIIPDENQ